MIVGLTGGIGSGKTTVAKMFNSLGVPCYLADDEAKRITEENISVKQKIEEIFGRESYKKGVYQRKFISKKVFSNPDLLQKLNLIIHPEVRKHFLNWYKSQTSSYVIKEAAILFESGTYKDCDYIINVVAPVEDRIKRVSERDNLSEKQIRNRINNQWTDEKRSEKSDFIIENKNIEDTLKKVKEIDYFLINKSLKNK